MRSRALRRSASMASGLPGMRPSARLRPLRSPPYCGTDTAAAGLAPGSPACPDAVAACIPPEAGAPDATSCTSSAMSRFLRALGLLVFRVRPPAGSEWTLRLRLAWRVQQPPQPVQFVLQLGYADFALALLLLGPGSLVPLLLEQPLELGLSLAGSCFHDQSGCRRSRVFMFIRVLGWLLWLLWRALFSVHALSVRCERWCVCWWGLAETGMEPFYHMSDRV